MKRKMVIIGIFYILGLFFASFFTIGKILILSAVILAVFAGFVAAKKVVWTVLPAVLVSIAAGAAIYSGYTASHYDPVMKLAGNETEFSGTVESVSEYKGGFASYIADGIFTDGTEAKIQCFTDKLDCEYGDTITVKGTFSVPEKNFLYDSTEYYRGMSVFLSADYGCEYTSVHTEDGSFTRNIISFRERMRRRFYALCGCTGGSLVSAMVLGDRQGLDDRTEAAFYNAGIGPMLALSGFHLIVFCGICGIFGSKTRLQRIFQLLVTIIMTVFFCLVSMSPISVLRAGIMMIISKSSCLFFRRADPLSSLMIAVVILTCTEPYLIHNAGFLLSVTGTFGVSTFAPWLTEKVKIKNIIADSVAKTALVSAVVTLCVMPVCLVFFPEVSLLSPLSNIIFAPMCVLIIILGTVMLFFGGNTFVSVICGDAVNAVSKLLSDSLRFLHAHFSFSISSGWDRLVYTAFILAGLVVLVCIITRSRRVTASVLAMAVLVTGCGNHIMQRKTGEILRIFIMGRGSGEAVIIAYGGKADIIDLSYNRKNAETIMQLFRRISLKNIGCLYLNDKVNAAVPSYKNGLMYLSADNVFISEDEETLEGYSLCGQYPVYTELYEKTEDEYSFSVYDGIITLNTCGRKMMITDSKKAEHLQKECNLLVSLGRNKCTITDGGVTVYTGGINIELTSDKYGIFDAGRLY